MWHNDVNTFTPTHTPCAHTTHFVCEIHTKRTHTYSSQQDTQSMRMTVYIQVPCAPCITFMHIKHTGVHAYLHVNWFLTGYYKDVTLPSATLSIHFYFDEKNSSRREKISPSENSEEKIPKTLSCISGYFWWLRELFENKETFHKASKIQKI